ncbi:hypothetical protein SAMN04487993_103710 [Salipiger marinus]|uniref:Uncharacterized protein n=1 Tax=Salipiger marinus TaxID=555512 RepID=A0A1G8U7Q7_9RHOB|nr:hypothetical protein SAMN04487993_103710 [Salipiger marinus]
MKVTVGQGSLWYNIRDLSPPTRWLPCGTTGAHTMVITGRNCPAACDATPQPCTFRAILSCELRGCASHVRTNRPSPRPRGAGLARVALRPPVASLPSRGFTPHAPVRGAFVLPATHDGGLASRHHPGAFLPLETLTGALPSAPTKACHPWNQTRAIAPLDHSPELSHPGTHDQSFRALDFEQGPSSPCTLTRGCVPSTTRRTRCSCTSAGFSARHRPQRNGWPRQQSAKERHETHAARGGGHGG